MYVLAVISAVKCGRILMGKMKMRFFRVPLVVSKFDSTSLLSQCWRDCGMVEDYVHIFC